MPRGQRHMRYLLRTLLAIGTIMLLAWLSYSAVYQIRTTPVQIRPVEYDASRALAFQFVREDSKRLIDAAILILAALWSVSVVKKDERLRARDFPEIGMFVAANLLLISFFYLTEKFTTVLEHAYWDVRSVPGSQLLPDVFNSPYLTLYYQLVNTAFYASLAVSAIVVLSLCLLREKVSLPTESKQCA